jgi:hypothetical protein
MNRPYLRVGGIVVYDETDEFALLFSFSSTESPQALDGSDYRRR